MDKKNVYYIVKKGTNEQVKHVNDASRPVLVQKEFVKKEVEYHNNWAGHDKYNAMSVEEYEETFEKWAKE